MSINRKILNEIERYRNINRYIFEQEANNADTTSETPPPPPPAGDDSMSDVSGGLGTDTGVDEIPEPVDVANDPDVEEVDSEGNTVTDTTTDTDTTTNGGDSEELDITELVTTQKNISDKQDEYMEGVLSKLDDLTNKLSQMDGILQKIDSLEQKVEKYRQKTPEEKLQLRSLDSYPYNQKLTDFFMDKQGEFEKTGKQEYILTPDEIESYSDKDIKKSFDRPFENEEMM